ncbi:hypothetical protein E2C01_098839 [Portunus trituberculatus]|uniref:Uncharacterized protein n=1 Tax=Portunus trituberculatus TaxID=210409 RepID=A0A5B7K990_PORTR|nr:hypothetical protein [Portunus trituberculatus]
MRLEWAWVGFGKAGMRLSWVKDWEEDGKGMGGFSCVCDDGGGGTAVVVARQTPCVGEQKCTLQEATSGKVYY